MASLILGILGALGAATIYGGIRYERSPKRGFPEAFGDRYGYALSIFGLSIAMMCFMVRYDEGLTHVPIATSKLYFGYVYTNHAAAALPNWTFILMGVLVVSELGFMLWVRRNPLAVIIVLGSVVGLALSGLAMGSTRWLDGWLAAFTAMAITQAGVVCLVGSGVVLRRWFIANK